MVRNQGREPTHALSSHFQIVRNPDWSTGHDLDLLRISTSSFRSLLNEANAPLDQVRIGELQNNAITHASSKLEYLWSISSNPHGRNATRSPSQPCFSTFVVNFLAAGEIAKIFYGFFQLRNCHRLFAKNA